MMKYRPTMSDRCLGRLGGKEHRRWSLGLRRLLGLLLSALAVVGCLGGTELSDGRSSSVQWNRCTRALDQAERTFADAPYRETINIDVGFVIVEEAWAAADPCLEDVDERTRAQLEAGYAEARRSECSQILSRAEGMLREASDQQSSTAGTEVVLLREVRSVANPCFGLTDESAFAQLESGYVEAERDVCLTIMGLAAQLFEEAPVPASNRIDAGYVLVEDAWAAAKLCLGYADESARAWLEASHAEAQGVECIRVLGRALRTYDDALERDRIVVELTRGQLQNAKSASERCLSWADQDLRRSLSAKSDNAFALLPSQVDRDSAREAQPTSRSPIRPAWCRHYDAWERAFDEAERLKARNSEFTADWSEYDLRLLEGFTDEFVTAAHRMWSAAPASENWQTAHRKCG